MKRLELDHISRRFGSNLAAVEDLSLALGAGEVVCLLGPSGCGKSTTLRIAAGVEHADSGRVLIDGRVVAEGDRQEPPESRSVGLMFQDFALFPHMSVGRNVAFGLRGMAKTDQAKMARDYLARVGLAGYEDKYPHMLSGGEQQRVALARALAPKPRVMLMDEPFSGLDNRLRDDVRDAALSLLKEEGASVLLVTHDPDEALKMGDRVALMRAGRIVQVGSPYAVYTRPVDRRAAAFFSDLNVMRAVVRNRQTDTPFGLFLTPGLLDGVEVEIAIRPQHFVMHEDGPPPPSARSGVAARGVVARARFVGSSSLIETRMDHDGSIVKATQPGVFVPQVGSPLWLSIRRDQCFVFPAEGQDPARIQWEPNHAAARSADAGK